MQGLIKCELVNNELEGELLFCLTWSCRILARTLEMLCLELRVWLSEGSWRDVESL